MPVWAAVVIGLGSGVASGLLGTLLSISHKRGAEWRTRMLDAAAEFLRRSEDLRRLARRGSDDPEFTVTLVRRTWDELVYAVDMIELLYGDWSKPTYYARGVGNELREVEAAIANAVAGDDRAPAEVQEHLTAASEALNEFSRLAALDVRQGWLRRRPRAIAWRVGRRGRRHRRGEA